MTKGEKPGILPISPANHEAFAQAVAAGTPAAIAYREHCSEGCTQKSSWENASKLLNSPKVAPRVKFLRGAVGRVAVHNFGVDAATLLRMHLEIATTPLGEVDENHPLCSKLKRKRRVEGGPEGKDEWIVEEVSLPCKSRSLEAIASLCGFNSAIKTEATIKTHDDTDDLLSNPAGLFAIGRLLRDHPEAARELRNGLEGRDFGDKGGDSAGTHETQVVADAA